MAESETGVIFGEALATHNALVEQLFALKKSYTKCAISRRTRGFVLKKSEILDSTYENVCKSDINLRTLPGFAESNYATKGIFDDIDTFYSEFSGDLADLLYSFDYQAPPPPVNNVPEPNPNIRPNQPDVQTLNFRLPQITLPTFSGDYASWSAFSDMFISLIHDNRALTNVQKLHYLKCNLRGAASNLLRNTTITNDNYEIAWNSLRTRFANKKALVDAQLKILIDQPIHSSESPSQIRDLIDNTQESLNSLRGLEINVQNWDPILLFILIKKLSKESHRAWETDQQGKADLASLADFIAFLENRFRMLETISNHHPSSSQSQNISKSPRPFKAHSTQVSSTSSTSASNTASKPCPICSELHFIRSCNTFLQMSIPDRRNIVKQHKVCFNCLVQGHLVPDCKNRHRCQNCNKSHHTLLHLQESSSSSSNTQQQATVSSSPSPSTSSEQKSNPFKPTPSTSSNTFISHAASLSSFDPPRVLLATTLINVISSNGQIISLRALVDQGSEVTLITTKAAQLLRLKSTNINLPLSGIGQSSAGMLRRMVNLDIRSHLHPEFALRANALVMNIITGMIPRSPCSVQHWSHLKDKPLADPTFATPGRIDVLLGADIYKQIILPGVLHGECKAPVAQFTAFGWILSGDIESPPRLQIQSNISTLHTFIDIDARLKSFWEIEEVSSSDKQHLTEDEIKCEEHYASTHTKAPDGRYVVRLPLRSPTQLGESRSSAMQRFFQIERSLNSRPTRKTSYVDFMREYIALGHMQKSISSSKSQPYIIPHHAVFKESSSTTKTRVVFDASNKSTNGQSLNDLLLIGPKIQDDLSAILLRWRKYPIALSSDVEKMYRQILVHPADQHFQHILWRESTDEPIVEYALQTVTYGTASAPYLAVRTLRQLSIDNELAYPEAARIVREDFYVDDLLSGAYSQSDAIFIRRQLSELLSKSGFNLRKWVSNDSDVLNEIPLKDRELQNPLLIDLNETVTALGIVWNPATDVFSFKVNISVVESRATKRNILSDISKLFDPLGWLAPIIIRSKILMQNLWVKGVDWDDLVPESVSSNWKSLRKDLYNLNQIIINRWIYHHNVSLELHGFSDASKNAYAAAVYARIQQPNGLHITTLLTAKTRVAPLKQISIPKLELCGAVLLAELLIKTQRDLKVTVSSIYAWTDSTIVLHWIRAEPRNWKTFVANRVSTIQQSISIQSWRHVPTADNPADCASRGLDVLSLQTFSLWWNGPKWLEKDSTHWPSSKTSTIESSHIDIQDLEQSVTCNIASTHPITQSTAIDMLQSYSSISHLLRITAICKRFISNFSSKWLKRQTNKTVATIVRAEELQEALQRWIIISQENSFQSELLSLRKNRELSSKSHILSLNPFIDDLGVLRVGGRIQNSNLPFFEKHPIILSNKCHLSELIIRQLHLVSLHGGPQLVLGLLRKKYWVLNARNAVRLHIYRCIKCHRFKATSASQLMGSLPEPRINLTRAFTHTGVDYAGPIDVRMSKGRGNSSYKGYISLFICLCTKAIHLEAVSDLTSNAFIAAYRRFVARRGLPSHMYSDNGTNFVGAVKILRKSHESKLFQVKTQIINNVTKDHTEWHFIPPSSPHFGGLWEAGVKSLKYHMKRTIGESKLTYEELSTLLTQIEACLNSRPLAPLTSDPDDLTALTPGHFLIGDSLLSPPNVSAQSSSNSPLSRWHQIQAFYQTIASRWQTEYLSRLQQRPKWVKQTRNLQVGDLVLIKDLNTSPMQWPLARVTATHPGADNLVRVVTVQTANSIFKRCITKISPLPI